VRRVFAMLMLAAVMATPVAAQPTRPIKANQTDAYGDDRLLAFTYFMNFQCVHEPFADLDHDGLVAAVDPDEFQSPRCVVGTQPRIDPTGNPISNTEPLYVIVPFFDADGDGEAATPGLRDALRGLFGFVPDAFDPTPGFASRRIRAASATWTTPIVARPPSSSGSSSPASASRRNLSTTVCDSGAECSTGLGP